MRQSRIVLGLSGMLLLAMCQSAVAQLAQYHNCTSQDPSPNEVYIYVDHNYLGQCAALSVGWYPYSGAGQNGLGGFGLPNDSISSYKIGSGVRMRTYWDWKYGGGYTLVRASSLYIEGWNDNISSIKVESLSRSQYCDDLQPGEFSLYSRNSQQNDCVVLKYPTVQNYTPIGYPDDVHMGIADNFVKSYNGGPVTSVGSGCRAGGYWAVTLYADPNYGGSSLSFAQGQSPTAMNGFEGKTSSVQSAVVCNPF